MTAHILNPQLDPEYPATLSKSTLTGLLRETLRFTRLIISDDLEMKAIADHYDPLKTAVLAVGAGCDLLIYRGDNGLPEAQIEAIVHAVEKGEIPQGLLDAAVRRIEAAKKLYATQDGPLSAGDIPTLVGLPEHSLLAETIALQVAKP